MSLFLDFPCTVGGGARVKHTAWCQTEPICAVATCDNRVSFYLEEGVCLDECKIERQCDASAVAWHPKLKLLATGWDDGHVSVWSIARPAEKREISCCFASDKKHRIDVAVLQWNPTGSRLLTCDSSGFVVVWKADSRGGLAALREYGAGGADPGITCAVYYSSLVIPRLNELQKPRVNGNKLLLGKPQQQQGTVHVFFVGTRTGNVCMADDHGHFDQVSSLGACVDFLLFYEAKNRLVVLTRSLVLVQLIVGSQGKAIPVMKMKVSVAGSGVSSLDHRVIRGICWSGPGVIAAATGEPLVRFWNLANDETYVVSLSSASRVLDKTSRAVSVSFNPLQRFLAVGTKQGVIAMWRFVGDYNGATKKTLSNSSDVTTSAADWEAIPISTACSGGPNTVIETLSWGPGQGILLAAAPDGATSVLSETVLHRLLRDDVGAIQVSTDTVRIERQSGSSALLRTDISIRGLAVSSNHIAVWNGQEARLYEWFASEAQNEPQLVSSFASTARAMALRTNETLIRTSTNLVELCNLQGVRKQKIPFSDAEGSPTHIDVNGNFLAVATDTGLIKVFQVDRRDPKQLGSPGKFNLLEEKENDDPEGTAKTTENAPEAETVSRQIRRAIRSIKCNCDGTRVSILADRVHGTAIRIREPDSRLHVYDSDRDVVDSHSFVSRFPVSHYWDPNEPKLLACETRALGCVDVASHSSKKVLSPPVETSYASLGLVRKTNAEEDCKKSEDDAAFPGRSSSVEESQGPANIEVTTMFVTGDHGMLLQDVFPLEAPLQALLGVQVPRLFFTRSGGHTEDDEADDVGLCSRVMRDFVGLDDSDEKTREALLNFSYYLTIGNMDEAHRAVRLIKSPSVWENMAHMCVKTKRLDVAEVCLKHMGHARGSAAVRLAKKGAPELEARLAAVAIQLGLRNDAARLYRECGRFDLLNELYQAAGEWLLALDTAKRHDRIHLRSTHHRYALHLESLGRYDAAARHFELADTHRREVPRMLVERGEQAALERYVMRSEDKELIKWWAGYCESLGHFDSARLCYEKANDHYNLVRVACVENDVERAASLVDENRSPAGAYHLARYLEGRGDISEAIQYFAKSGCYNHAIRLAKEYGLDTDLMQFCIMARPSLQVECAHYFEGKGEFEKAVQLYQKGGDLSKALDLCFKVGGGRSEMFEVLANISNDIDEKTKASPAVLARCAEFFVEHEQFHDAAKLYVRCGRYTDAITMCVDRKVEITAELAEAMTPAKSPPKQEQKNEEMEAAAKKQDDGAVSNEERNAILLELARALFMQSSFQLACKKYTQAGDKEKALKCLLKSGDTKNIIYYASKTRHRDTYILAANYLQSLDWQSGTTAANELTKKIVEFYTKAKAHNQLAAFYDAYAQSEIDEYRDYEKAANALRESREQLKKADQSMDRERRIQALDQRILTVNDFVEARRYEKSDPQKMVDLCTSILQRRDVQSAIRVGDAFAMLIEFHWRANSAHEAFGYVQQMREKNIVLQPYIDHELLVQIHHAVGADLPGDEAPISPNGDEIPEEEEDEDDFDDKDRHRHK